MQCVQYIQSTVHEETQYIKYLPNLQYLHLVQTIMMHTYSNTYGREDIASGSTPPGRPTNQSRTVQ